LDIRAPTIYPSLTNVLAPKTGITATVPSPLGSGFTEGFWERLDQGNGWPGNFAFGTPLIYNPITNPDNPALIFSLIFSAPIQGAGAQLQIDHYGTFQVNVSAFDANNEVLPIGPDIGGVLHDSFSVVGNSTANAKASRIGS
jgi:hypothetical protein